jgi:hypothetical protein
MENIVEDIYFTKINLLKTNYKPYKDSKILTDINIPELNEIYYKYARYKKFKSFMPIHDCEYTDNEIMGYFDKGKLVAWSMISIYDDKNAECYQFAWDYKNPKLHLGIKSLRNECAIYKARGFVNYYLGFHSEYKAQIKGYEVLGPLNEI